MQTFMLVFIMMLIGFIAMAIGYMVQRKSIAGSCGGLGAMGIEKACDCDNPCPERQQRMAERERKAKINEWKKNQIS
jgi:uncharacterized protein